MREKPKSVFVPFELKGQLWVKCDDLPRFLEPKQVIHFLSRSPGLAVRRLDWVEHFDHISIDEYLNYIGEPRPGLVH